MIVVAVLIGGERIGSHGTFLAKAGIDNYLQNDFGQFDQTVTSQFAAKVKGRQGWLRSLKEIDSAVT